MERDEVTFFADSLVNNDAPDVSMSALGNEDMCVALHQVLSGAVSEGQTDLLAADLPQSSQMIRGTHSVPVSSSIILTTKEGDAYAGTPSTAHRQCPDCCAVAISRDVVDFGEIIALCRRGVPDHVRPTFWKIIMGFYPLESVRWEAVEMEKESEYRLIVSSVSRACAGDGAVLTYAFDRVIDADVPRTMSSLHFFLSDGRGELGEVPEVGGSLVHTVREEGMNGTEGMPEPNLHFTSTQNCLRRIMRTSAVVNKGLGYVQGMNEVIGHLLYAYAEGDSRQLSMRVEADAFFCFQTMLSYLGDDFCCSLDFDPVIGVSSRIRHYDKALCFFDSELYDHLQAIGVYSEYYALRWMTLLFSQEFNAADVMRVWDFVFSFGDQLSSAVVFVAVAMTHTIRSTLLEQDSASGALPFLQEYPSCDVQDFLKEAMRWITRLGLPLMAHLKETPLEEVRALRQSHKRWSSSRSDGGIAGWMRSVMGA